MNFLLKNMNFLLKKVHCSEVVVLPIVIDPNFIKLLSVVELKFGRTKVWINKSVIGLELMN